MIDPAKLAEELGVDPCECHRAFFEELNFVYSVRKVATPSIAELTARDRIKVWFNNGKTESAIEHVKSHGVANFVRKHRWSKVWATFEGMKAAGVKEVPL